MRYPKLKGLCKDCLGCMRLENPNFIGVYKCKWYEEETWETKKWEQEKINYRTKNKL